MRMTQRFTKLVSPILILCLSSFSLYVPMAQAALVGTQAVLGAPSATLANERARIASLLQRQDVQTQLKAYGADPAQVQARVNALSDAEVHALATQIDSVPAGGDGLVAVLLVFLILIITDLMGITHIFTFIR